MSVALASHPCVVDQLDLGCAQDGGAGPLSWGEPTQDTLGSSAADPFRGYHVTLIYQILSIKGSD